MAIAKTIDTHAHYFPESYINLIREHGKRVGTTVTTDDNGVTFIQVGLHLRTGPITRLFIDLDARIKDMDRRGVGMHALSLTQLYWLMKRFSSLGSTSNASESCLICSSVRPGGGTGSLGLGTGVGVGAPLGRKIFKDLLPGQATGSHGLFADDGIARRALEAVERFEVAHQTGFQNKHVGLAPRLPGPPAARSARARLEWSLRTMSRRPAPS